MSITAEFERKTEHFISPYQKDKIIVGLSGGADSVALLTSLCAVGCSCIAAHCNFMLRGDESERDMIHSMEVAKKNGTEFIAIRFDVPAYMKSHKCSLETACRELRYQWFEELRQTKDAKWIAVGHHREDNNETFFLNLFRGTGIRGLKGMRPVNGNIIRPLIEFTKKDIENYLNEKGIAYITDSSNLIADVARNRIRNNIMPIIRQAFPNADKSVNTTISNLYSAEQFISEMIRIEKNRWNKNGSIDISKIIEEIER